MKNMLLLIIGFAIGAGLIVANARRQIMALGTASLDVPTIGQISDGHARQTALSPFGKRPVMLDAKGDLQIYLQARFIEDPAWGAKISETMSRIRSIHGIDRADTGSIRGVSYPGFITVRHTQDTDWNDLAPLIAPIIDERFPP